jgi:hypothetical protein
MSVWGKVDWGSIVWGKVVFPFLGKRRLAKSHLGNHRLGNRRGTVSRLRKALSNKERKYDMRNVFFPLIFYL